MTSFQGRKHCLNKTVQFESKLSAPFVIIIKNHNKFKQILVIK